MTMVTIGEQLMTSCEQEIDHDRTSARPNDEQMS
jgi:hypothetical protein